LYVLIPEFAVRKMAATLVVNCVFIGDGSITSICIDTAEGMTVALLKDAIKEKKMYGFPADQLMLFLAKDGDGWLAADSTDVASLENGVFTERLRRLLSEPIDPAKEIGDLFGGAPTDLKIHVLVKLTPPVISLIVKGHPLSLAPLDNREELTRESLLTEWETGMVHDVPLMYNFMKDLGGCSTNGKIYWRREDQQLVSLLVKLWFQENISDTLNSYKGRQSIVVGAQGVGKSTMLCMLAFYLVMTRKKSVLVYRRLTRGNCLFYLGYDDAKREVRYFTGKRCWNNEAILLYEQLSARLKFENLWLLLDGFEYDKIPDGLRSFELLTTSLHVDLKSQESEAAFTCLLSSWKKTDILKLGHEVCGFGADEAAKRYYFSGGDLWQFRLATKWEIKLNADFALWRVQDASKLLSSNWSGSDRLQQTFIRDKLAERENEDGEWAGFLGLLSCEYWDQVVDSEYVVHELTRKLSAANKRARA
jgi:hypothetical protein